MYLSPEIQLILTRALVYIALNIPDTILGIHRLKPFRFFTGHLSPVGVFRFVEAANCCNVGLVGRQFSHEDLTAIVKMQSSEMAGEGV